MVSGGVLFGMFLALTSTAMSATGMNLQRLGQRKEKQATSLKNKRRGRNLNHLGIFLATSCGLLDLISFGYAPQTLLAPLGALGLIFNLLLAPILHGEELGMFVFLLYESTDA